MESGIRAHRRQALVLIVTVAAAFVAAGSASGNPIEAKRAQARSVLAEINQLEMRLERARTRYESSTRDLAKIDKRLAVNRVGLRAAKANLRAAQTALMQWLVLIYMTRDDQSTLGVVLGAKNIGDLVNRIEAVESVSRQDRTVLNDVMTFENAITIRQVNLQNAKKAQVRLVRERRAAKAQYESQITRQRRLYNSIRGQISQLVAQARARALASAAAVRARYNAAQRAADAATPAEAVGASPSTPGGVVAPPSRYGGAVGIAMRYLGVPYLWGGATPSGFDCSGFTMYVFAQVGVSLPHYTGAQWQLGVPVARSELQPGDLVFFNGLGHMGIYIGGNQMIHAPRTGDVVKISALTGWYAQTYMGARRITG